MTPLRWTDIAVEDLEEIYAFIAKDSPKRAAATVSTLLSASEQLEDYPNLGRAGREEGTRELLVVNPYVIVYTVEPDRAVRIESVLHGARRY